MESSFYQGILGCSCRFPCIPSPTSSPPSSCYSKCPPRNICPHQASHTDLPTSNHHNESNHYHHHYRRRRHHHHCRCLHHTSVSCTLHSSCPFLHSVQGSHTP